MKNICGVVKYVLVVGGLLVSLTACTLPVFDGEKNLQTPSKNVALNNKYNTFEQGDFQRRINNINKASRHLSKSHTRNLLLRPFSSVSSLFFLVLNTSVDFIKDSTLDFVAFPMINRTPVPDLSDAPAMDLVQWEKTLDRLVGPSTDTGTIELLIDGDSFFTRFEEAVHSAESEILLRTYIFDNDDYAIKIADLLKRKSKSIPVRVLYDGVGTISGGMVSPESLPMYHQSPHSIKSYLEEGSEVQVRKLNNPWLVGDHTKVILVDEDTAFVGGMNIGREYRYDWHDMMFEVNGEVVDQLKADAERAWQHSGILGDFSFLSRQTNKAKLSRSETKGYPLRLLYTLPHKPEIYRAQLAAVRHSSKYIYIQNAYFSDDQMLYELVKARRRGVDVRVILPSRGDNGPMDRSNVLAVNTMLRHGIRVFIYPSMSHVKAAIYDGWACFGTANFDKMSLRVNKELNIGTSNPDVVNALKEKLFDVDFAQSIEVTESLSTSWQDHIYERLADVAL